MKWLSNMANKLKEGSRREKATKAVKDAGGVGSGKSTQSGKKFSGKKSGKAFPWSK
jgi:hypothetical protein